MSSSPLSGPGTPIALGTPNGAEGGEATSMSSDVIVNVGGRGQTHRQQARFLVRPNRLLSRTPIRVEFVATNISVKISHDGLNHGLNFT